MREPLTQSQDDAKARAARLIAGALNELMLANQESSALAEEVSRNRIAIETMSQRFEQQLTEERHQRRMLAEQITGLAGSLDRLVTHLEGASTLMTELVERISNPYSGTSQPPAREITRPVAVENEPLFQPGGEGRRTAMRSMDGVEIHIA